MPVSGSTHNCFPHSWHPAQRASVTKNRLNQTVLKALNNVQSKQTRNHAAGFQSDTSYIILSKASANLDKQDSIWCNRSWKMIHGDVYLKPLGTDVFQSGLEAVSSGDQKHSFYSIQKCFVCVEIKRPTTWMSPINTWPQLQKQKRNNNEPKCSKRLAQFISRVHYNTHQE